MRTPAAQDFLNLAPVRWTPFQAGDELKRLVTLDLIRILQNPKNRYGLSLTELELLHAHGQRINEASSASRPVEAGGAEGGGILLDFGHREPLSGVALDKE